jgi:hypothetical protein
MLQPIIVVYYYSFCALKFEITLMSYITLTSCLISGFTMQSLSGPMPHENKSPPMSSSQASIPASLDNYPHSVSFPEDITTGAPVPTAVASCYGNT